MLMFTCISQLLSFAGGWKCAWRGIFSDPRKLQVPLYFEFGSDIFHTSKGMILDYADFEHDVESWWLWTECWILMIVRMVLYYAYFEECCWSLMILELMLDCDDFRDDAGFWWCSMLMLLMYMRSRTRNQPKTLLSPPQIPARPPQKKTEP